MNTILFSVGVIGNVLSFVVFLVPIKTFSRVVKNQSTEEFEPAPYVVTLLGSLLWVYYGVTKPGEYLVATVNGVGIILEAIYVLIFLVYASPAVRARTAILVAILDVGFFGGVVLVTQLAIEKELQVSVTGVICACLNIFMYASPLAVMKTVITTKSVEYMPFLLSFSLFLNGGVWTLYAILDKNIFLGLPNGIGCFLGAIQLILYMIYMNTKASKSLGVDASCDDGLLQRQRLIDTVEHDEERGQLT